MTKSFPAVPEKNVSAISPLWKMLDMIWTADLW